MNTKSIPAKVLPVLFGFFIVGFVDLVGIANSYIKFDFKLTDTIANVIPLMVFVWFAVFSIPSGLLMNSIGRKKTVLISMVITLVALVVPLIMYNFVAMLIAFSLIGIGNTILQVSINPLLSNVLSENKLTSGLTWGQFIKAIAAFLGPVICLYATIYLGSWKFIFVIYSIIIIVSALWLFYTKIDENNTNQKVSTFANCFSLLKNKTILLLFLGIVFAVGIDIGLNTSIPKFLMQQFNIPLQKAGLGSSLYFIARLTGTFIGAFLLLKFSGRNFMIVSMIAAILAMASLFFATNLIVVLVLIFIIGLAVANVFSILFSLAIKQNPGSANEVSGLMIMGIAGGAIILPIMGIVSDKFGQLGGMAILLLSMVYLLLSTFRLAKNEQ